MRQGTGAQSVHFEACGDAPRAVQAIPVTLTRAGDWRVEVAARLRDGGAVEALLPVATPTIEVVRDLCVDDLPVYSPGAPGWNRGLALPGVRADECTARFALDPESLRVCRGCGPDSAVFERGKDYEADLEWGTLGRLAGGSIGPRERVLLSYRYGVCRIDSIVLGTGGELLLRQGSPHIATPWPPDLHPGENRLANLFIEARLAALDDAHIFPVTEPAYPEAPPPTPSVAEALLPKTMGALLRGEELRILAWGDSVTDGRFLPGGERDRWQDQLVERLRRRFPSAAVTLTTEAWGGRNTASYLAEPPGAAHNYREKVLGARPDLVVSEFVNDGGLGAAEVGERYGALLADFRAIGAEWIILTPHYVRPDWMGLSSQRDIDEDPRPYVHGLRDFAAKHRVPLADASLRWGRLWRQGIPYNTLMHNTINHPDVRGMRLFVDSLMELFPAGPTRAPLSAKEPVGPTSVRLPEGVSRSLLDQERGT